MLIITYLAWARTMCKYGDFFLYLDIDDKYGVQSVISLPIAEVERLEGQRFNKS